MVILCTFLPSESRTATSRARMLCTLLPMYVIWQRVIQKARGYKVYRTILKSICSGLVQASFKTTAITTKQLSTAALTAPYFIDFCRSVALQNLLFFVVYQSYSFYSC